MFRKCGVKKHPWRDGLGAKGANDWPSAFFARWAKKSPDVETPGLWYLDLISVEL